MFVLYLIGYSKAKREERQARKRQQTDDVNAILCNSVKMIREKLTVSEGKLSPDSKPFNTTAIQIKKIVHCFILVWLTS